jgi:hypothetical protein
MSNYITIKLRRGTQAQWTATNPVLAEGEFGAETDTRKFKIGNGVTAWNSLQYWGSSGGGAADFTDLGDVPASYTGAAGKYVKVKADESGLEFGTLTIAAGDLPSGIDAAKIANGTVSNTEFQYLNGVTAPIQAALDFLTANKVPYSGASGDVNLGEHGIKAGQIDLDTSPTGTATVGTTRWNDTIGSSETTLKGGNVILKNGVDLVARVVNKVTPNTTLTKAAYQAVRVSGAQGQRLAVALAQANNDNNSADTIGLVIETIDTNQEGFIMTVGQLQNINTTGSLQGETWVDGDVIYLSPTTAGALTNVKPVAPNHIVIIGYVEYAHANNGKLYVKVMNGWELGELHDVDTTESKTTPIDADAILLQDSADSSVWKRLTWANLKATAKAYFDTVYAAIVHTHVIGDVTNLQTTLDGKVDENAAITAATKTKITYDEKGLVTAGADAGISDITGLQTALDAKAALAGATFTGLIVSPAATTAGAGLRIPHGTAPTAPTNGDLWTTTTGLFMRQNGVNKQFVDFDTSQTINGNKTFSNANGTFGSSTAASTYNFASGATISGATKTVNFGTGGVAGSTTNINIGSPTGTSTTTLQGTTNGVTQAAATNNLTLATTAFVRQEINGQAVFTSTTNGLAPLSGGGTTNFLRADGTWAAPAGGGGGAVQLYNSTASTGPNNTTTKTAIASYALPTNLAAGDVLEMKVVGYWKNNTGGSTRTMTIAIELGATSVFTASVTAANQTTDRIFEIRMLLFVVSTTSQKISLISFTGGAAPGASAVMNTANTALPWNHNGYGTASENLTTAKTWQIAVTTPYAVTAGQDLYMLAQACSIVKYPAP